MGCMLINCIAICWIEHVCTYRHACSILYKIAVQVLNYKGLEQSTQLLIWNLPGVIFGWWVRPQALGRE